MTNNQRQYTKLDQFCMRLDQVIRTVVSVSVPAGRPYPAANLTEPPLSVEERRHAAGLMRVNHAGEVAAQALYHGQGLVSHNPHLQQHLQEAASEEGDHLAWCGQRLLELGSHTSYLSPLWYAGSFAIGLVAGVAGDKWSLGFVAETEQQVVQHLKKHLALLPAADLKSITVLQQMQIDEGQHRDAAIHAGAVVLPELLKKLMRLTAKVMVKTAFWI